MLSLEVLLLNLIHRPMEVRNPPYSGSLTTPQLLLAEGS